MTIRTRELCDRPKRQVLPLAGLLLFLIVLQDEDVAHPGCIQSSDPTRTLEFMDETSKNHRF